MRGLSVSLSRHRSDVHPSVLRKCYNLKLRANFLYEYYVFPVTSPHHLTDLKVHTYEFDYWNDKSTPNTHQAVHQAVHQAAQVLLVADDAAVIDRFVLRFSIFPELILDSLVAMNRRYENVKKKRTYAVNGELRASTIRQHACNICMWRTRTQNVLVETK